MIRYLAYGAVVIGAALCCMQPTVAQDDNEPYLATITAERAAGVDGQLPATIRATLHVNDPARSATAFAEVDGIDVVAQAHDSLDIVFGPGATLTTGLPESHFLGNSFVIDYEEPAVQQLLADIADHYDGIPTVEQLTGFVYSHVADKTYSRAFDLASRVAETGSGDCTEHAVLLAALARAQGYPSRVVLGTLMIDTTQHSRAYGHAWAEIHNGGDWQIADATRPETASDVLQLRYLPLSALDNEGPGYALALMQSVALMPSRISEITVAE